MGNDGKTATKKELSALWGKRSKHNERNVKMALQVLGGDSLNAVGETFEVSQERVRQVLAKYCKNANPNYYKKMPAAVTINTRWVRANKAYFL